MSGPFAVALSELGRCCRQLRATRSLSLVRTSRLLGYTSKLPGSQKKRWKDAPAHEWRTIGLPARRGIGLAREKTALASHGVRGAGVGRELLFVSEKGIRVAEMRVRDKKGCPSNRKHASLMYVTLQTPLRHHYPKGETPTWRSRYRRGPVVRLRNLHCAQCAEAGGRSMACPRYSTETEIYVMIQRPMYDGH